MRSVSTSRRRFLKNSALIALAPTVPSFLARTARASDAARDATVLVVIQLDGGNDGINTVVPYADEGYAAHRQQLRLAAGDLIKLDDHVALHPRMPRAGELFDDGRLAIVQGVGYPNPNRSHFQSMAIWQSASLDTDLHDGPGWLGQSLSLQWASRAERCPECGGLAALPGEPGGEGQVRCCAGAALGKSGPPQAAFGKSGLQGPDTIYVGPDELPVALRGRRCHSVTIASEEDLQLTLEDLADTDAAQRDGSDLTSYVQRSVLEAYSSAKQLSFSGDGTDANARYPSTKLASQLELVSQLIKSGAAARVYYTTQPGYDTHAVQLPTHANLLGDFSSSLAAFLDDLKAAGLDQRVMVLAFSEFGRRVKENGSLGTDHGTAGPVFLAGPNVQPGLCGKTPPLSDLDAGDLKHTIDFRQVYAAILEDWLHLPRPETLAGFEKLSIVRPA